jgi:hypothetical protein
VDGPLIRLRAPAAPNLRAPNLHFEPSQPIETVVDKPSPATHAGLYATALLTRFGFEAVRGRDARDRLLRAQEAAWVSDEPAWLVGLNRRATKPGFLEMEPWLSDCGAVSAEGLAIFDLRRVMVERQFGS